MIDKGFRDERVARTSDIFIAVMGTTGTGKSSFIANCCSKKPAIGRDLNSCTKTVEVYPCEYSPNCTIYLIDTPGFDDTNGFGDSVHRSDTEVLRTIAAWLTDSYTNKILLSGIIYLHRISDNKMQGSAIKNMLMFKKLCGQDAMKNVILATTMWDLVTAIEAEAREKQLVETEPFWGSMIQNGSRVARLRNDRGSAMQLLSSFVINSDRKMKLDLQVQMVDKEMTLDQTAAGMQLEAQLAKQREEFLQQLKEARQSMEEALILRDAESSRAMQKLEEQYTSHLDRLEKERKELHTNMEELLDQRIAELEKRLSEQHLGKRYIYGTMLQEEIQEVRHDRQQSSQDRVVSQKESQEKIKQSSSERLIPRGETQGPKSSLSFAKASTPKSTIPEFERVHVSLCGRQYYFSGQIGNAHRFATSQSKSSDYWNRRCHGEGGSWLEYLPFDLNGTRFNLDKSYPGLKNKLDEFQFAKAYVHAFACLGPQGTCYARQGSVYISKLGDSITKELGLSVQNQSLDGVAVMALGNSASYIIKWDDGTTTWNLRGLYPDLLPYLHANERDIQAVCLDLEGDTQWILVTLSGEILYNITAAAAKKDIKKWESEVKECIRRRNSLLGS